MRLTFSLLLLAALAALPALTPAQLPPHPALAPVATLPSTGRHADPLGSSLLPQQDKAGPQNRGFGRKPVSDEVSRRRHALSDAIHGHQLKQFHKMMAVVKFPAAFDCRSQWSLPEIDDQGPCGDCYWWSSMRAVITANIVAGTVSTNKIGTSIKGTVQCGLDYHPDQGGCDGGDEYECASLALSKGFPCPDQYPGNGQSQGSKRPITGQLLSVKSLMFCTPGAGPNSRLVVADVKACLVKWGPVSFAAAASSWGNGDGVVTSNDNQVNHAITIYGWDDSKGPKGAWLVMNQWSKQWGNQGFLWLGYDACGACEGFVCVVDPVGSPVPNVVGDTLGDATAALKTAGFTVGNVTGDKAQKVASQSPAAGTAAAPGTAVDLAFGSKPPVGTPPFVLWESGSQVGNQAGYPDLAAAEKAGQALADKDGLPVAIYDSAKPAAQLMETLMPQTPPAPLGSLTIPNITAQQTAAIMQQLGGVIITPTTTLRELADMMKRNADKKSK